MGHHHGHDNADAAMPFHEKARRIIDHWMKHNADHAAEYRRWAAQFRQHAMDGAADALERAAAENEHINTTLMQASQALDHPS